MLIQKHNPNWKTDFEKIDQLLRETLNGLILTIEHVGSTSVPNLDAKAIIDIDIVFEGDVFLEIKKKLASIGYFHNGDQGIRDREVFKRRKDAKHEILDSKSHHLYVCHQESEELKRHILFRGHLRGNKEARELYAQLKNELAEKANQNKKKYAQLKEKEATNFINECIRKQEIKNEK